MAQPGRRSGRDHDGAVAEQVYTGLSPITFSGTASDNAWRRDRARHIKNTANGLYWRSNNTWGGYQTQNATLGTPNGTSTTRNYTWTPPMTGSFSVLVESVDTSGNVAVPADEPVHRVEHRPTRRCRRRR